MTENFQRNRKLEPCHHLERKEVLLDVTIRYPPIDHCSTVKKSI